MAYDPDPNATYDPVTGTVVPTVWLDLLNANFAEIGAAWTSYTPTWAGSGSAPDIGNGTIAGAYKLLGKLLFVRIRVVMGSSTTYGSGTYFFTLPASLTGASGVEQTMSGKAYDSSLGANHPLVGFVQPASPSVEAIAQGTGQIGPTVPFTFADGDSILFTGAIEVA